MNKLYDLAVKTGEYEKDGQTKGRYLNIGAIMEKDDGGRFILLNRTFNPAGVPNPDNRDNLIVSMFGANKQNEPEPQETKDDDSIPF